MNKYTVDLENKRLVEVAGIKNPGVEPAIYQYSHYEKKHYHSTHPFHDAEEEYAHDHTLHDEWEVENKKYQHHLASLTTYPLQSVPEGWVQDMVVEEGKDFLLQYEVYGTVMKGEWWPISEQLYDADKDSIKRIIAIPIVVSAAVEKFEQAIKEFGVDAAMEYFCTPDDAKEIIAKEISECRSAGKEDEMTVALEIIKDESDKIDVRKYTCINGMGYSQFERNIAERILSIRSEGYWNKRAQGLTEVLQEYFDLMNRSEDSNHFDHLLDEAHWNEQAKSLLKQSFTSKNK